MSLEAHLDLVAVTFYEINPLKGRELENRFGVKGIGLIPLEVPIDVLQDRARSLGVDLKFKDEGTLFGKRSRMFSIGEPGKDLRFFLFEIDDVLYVPNFNLEEFIETFSRVE